MIATDPLSGFPVLSVGHPVTSEDVAEALDDWDDLDAAALNLVEISSGGLNQSNEDALSSGQWPLGVQPERDSVELVTEEAELPATRGFGAAWVRAAAEHRGDDLQLPARSVPRDVDFS